ncbi:hypothetical protein NSX49_23405, partial [Salmonella enterica]|nr:hypothetical protein [Salmonella enterica]MCR2157764.1 hypothetical protein [Salmonella enterica]MCR2162286.1 hypothetical protein [Salmonella enterica]MCR2171677.1 hypothetical protein [Salmonella enterica]MCR2176200.1 hypothetical protein [Salmonella enterica]
MKIAVMNYSGSVGKTIISSYLLYPRMAGAKFFAIETINMSAADLGVDEVMRLTGDNFGQLVEEIGTVAKLAMRQPFVLFKGLTFQKLCL